MRAREFIVEDKESRTEEFHGVHMKLRDDGYEVVASALDDWGREMGSVVFNKGDGNELDPQDLLVIDKFRGQGIAKVMYDYVKSKGYTIHRSYDQTDAGKGFWDKHRGEDVRVWESTNVVTNQQVWDYVGGIHPADQQGGGFLKSLIMLNPQYELKRVPLSSLHIPDEEDEGNDPYNRAMFVDVDHAKEFSQYHVDKKPLVVDSQGHILDGAHRAWAARELLNRKDIMAYVPLKARANSPQDLEIRKKFINQNVTEAFDQPYDIRWSKGDHGDYDAYAELDDGSGLEIAFLDQQHNSWMVDFFRDNSTEITGEGDAYRVFATVLTAIREFIVKQKPAKLNFSAEKQDDPKGSRARLYDRMIQRYISGTGYNLTKENYPDGAVYSLTRIEQD